MLNGEVVEITRASFKSLMVALLSAVSLSRQYCLWLLTGNAAALLVLLLVDWTLSGGHGQTGFAECKPVLLSRQITSRTAAATTLLIQGRGSCRGFHLALSHKITLTLRVVEPM